MGKSTVDSGSLKAALKELVEVSRDIPVEVLNRLLDCRYKLVSVKCLPTVGAATWTLEPNSLLVDVLFAVRTGNIERFVL